MKFSPSLSLPLPSLTPAAGKPSLHPPLHLRPHRRQQRRLGLYRMPTAIILRPRLSGSGSGAIGSSVGRGDSGDVGDGGGDDSGDVGDGGGDDSGDVGDGSDGGDGGDGGDGVQWSDAWTIFSGVVATSFTRNLAVNVVNVMSLFIDTLPDGTMKTRLIYGRFAVLTLALLGVALMEQWQKAKDRRKKERKESGNSTAVTITVPGTSPPTYITFSQTDPRRH